MIAEKLLSRLDGVRRSSKPDSWLAKCPAHDDRSPSLAITETNGKVLIRCFADCSPDEIVGAVGLELSDLFPEPDWTQYHHPRVSAKFPASEVLQAIVNELVVVKLALLELHNTGALSMESRQRLKPAFNRISGALRALGHGG
ncbi:DNA primase [Ectothiorhodospiraceae bacterium BW-2]|nr:DNA primase [Ectothiorhodospiraceae bacterium BW-2]